MFEQIREIADHTSLTAAQFYYREINRVCNDGTREENLPWEIKVEYPKGKGGILGTIASTLAKNKPVGINYQTKVYNTNGRNGNHASIIVGKKMHNERCVFIVRNTYGHCSCNDGRDEQTHGGGCSEMPHNYNENIDCDSESGHMLIPTDELLNNLSSINYLERKNEKY